MSDTGGGTGTQPSNVLALSTFGGGGPGSQTDLMSWGGGTGGGDGGGVAPDDGATPLRPYNQRIELPSVDDSDGEGGRGGGGIGGGGGAGGGGGSGDDDGIHDLDEDELTRDKVKKAASHVRGKRMIKGVGVKGCILAVQRVKGGLLEHAVREKQKVNERRRRSRVVGKCQNVEITETNVSCRYSGLGGTQSSAHHCSRFF